MKNVVESSPQQGQAVVNFCLILYLEALKIIKALKEIFHSSLKNQND